MSEQSFPPPGPPVPPGAEPPEDAHTASPWSATPGPYPGPGYPGYPPGTATPARPPAYGGAAHKPGAIPLQPLTLGSIYDGAFRIIRFNPRATVGGAVLVAAVAMLVPLVVTTLLTATTGLSPELAGAFSGDVSDSGESADLTSADVVWIFALVCGALLTQIGVLLVTGIVCRVTLAAALGRRLSLGEAWAETRGQRWRLVGLSVFLGVVAASIGALAVVVVVIVGVVTGDVLVTVLFGVLVGALTLVGLTYFFVRLAYLAVPALMVERRSVFGAVGRAYRLSRGQFWRILGISLLTAIIVGIAGQIVGFPIGIAGQIALLAASPEAAALITVGSFTLQTVASTAFTTPFTAAVSSLLYLDQRMRKEGYDVELMRMAGVFDVR